MKWPPPPVCRTTSRCSSEIVGRSVELAANTRDESLLLASIIRADLWRDDSDLVNRGGEALTAL